MAVIMSIGAVIVVMIMVVIMFIVEMEWVMRFG